MDTKTERLRGVVRVLRGFSHKDEAERGYEHIAKHTHMQYHDIARFAQGRKIDLTIEQGELLVSYIHKYAPNYTNWLDPSQISDSGFAALPETPHSNGGTSNGQS
jgi:hypothetical protein